jgi:hypothetical protein
MYSMELSAYMTCPGEAKTSEAHACVWPGPHPSPPGFPQSVRVQLRATHDKQAHTQKVRGHGSDETVSSSGSLRG